jgi:hypothetical protein
MRPLGSCERGSAKRNGGRAVSPEPELTQAFVEAWRNAADDPVRPPPVADNWRYSLRTWERMGLTVDDIGYAIHVMVTRNVPPDDRFRYFAGVCWTLLKERSK